MLGKVWTVKDSWKHWALQREWKPSVRNTFHLVQILIKWFCITTFNRADTSLLGANHRYAFDLSCQREMVVYHLLMVKEIEGLLSIYGYTYSVSKAKLQAWRILLYNLRGSKLSRLMLRHVLSPPRPSELVWSEAVVPQRYLIEARLWSTAILLDFASGFSAECLARRLPREQSNSRLNERDFSIAFGRL